MTNEEILQIAAAQSAIDANCYPEDFFKDENVVVISAKNPGARRDLDPPFYCQLVSYGNNVVASVHPDVADFVKAYLDKYPVEDCFETPNMYVLDEGLKKGGMSVCFMSQYFLPDAEFLSVKRCRYETKVLHPADFQDLYLPEWSNALCDGRRQWDALAVAAYSNDRLIGLAGCSQDCDSMWQVGVDVLPEYRRQGIASALTSRLAVETLKRGKVPFYCSAWSNIKSVRNAIRSGFRPAWVGLTAKPLELVLEMNR